MSPVSPNGSMIPMMPETAAQETAMIQPLISAAILTLREMAHTEIGFAVMTRGVSELVGMGHPDAPPKLIGRNIHVMLTPLAPNKRKPKFHPLENSPAVDDGPDLSGDDEDDHDEPTAGKSAAGA